MRQRSSIGRSIAHTLAVTVSSQADPIQQHEACKYAWFACRDGRQWLSILLRDRVCGRRQPSATRLPSSMLAHDLPLIERARPCLNKLLPAAYNQKHSSRATADPLPTDSVLMLITILANDSHRQITNLNQLWQLWPSCCDTTSSGDLALKLPWLPTSRVHPCFDFRLQYKAGRKQLGWDNPATLRMGTRENCT